MRRARERIGLYNGDVPDRRMFSSHSTRRDVGLPELFRPGDHACYFFRSGADIGEVLVPYFKAGLERNELCMWFTGPPYGKDRATDELRADLADFDRRAKAGQISIVDYEEWLAKQDMMGPVERARSWLARTDEAIASGYAGLRASGNASFLDESAWDEFLVCERAGTEFFTGQRITVLCGYGFDRCSAKAVVDVVHCHGLGLAKRHGGWGLLEVRSHGGMQAARQDHRHAPSAGQEEELRRVVEDQLAMFIGAHPERIALKGGRVDLSRPQATKLAILLSELTTNAAKHGALASPSGKLAVQWRIVSNGSRRLHVEWTESGVANLAVPETVGSGTQLMAGIAENCVRLFGPAGMVCAFELSLGN
jgi:anti-sigma regulatory factor (Ser/Thr protein kinase)